MRSRPHEEFLRLYQPVHDALVRYCSSHAYGIIETEDLVQDTVLATMKNFHAIHDKDKLLSYMISVANNIVKGCLRRKKFSASLSEERMKDIECGLPGPEVAHDIRILYEALNKLPLQEKEAVLLFEISGFSMREIAGIQRTTEGAARVRVHRARQKLRGVFAAEGMAYEQSGGKTLLSILM